MVVLRDDAGRIEVVLSRKVMIWIASTLFTGIVAAAIMLVDTWASLNVLQASTTTMQVQIADLARNMSDGIDHRYRSTDAAEDFALRDRRLDDHEQRIRMLERERYE